MRTKPKAAIAIVLAATAGWVDLLGYREISGVLTAHMSGNTAELGRSLALWHWRTALERLAPLGGFMAGVALGVLLSEFARRAEVARRLALVLAVEIGLLGLGAITSTGPSKLLPLLALALGMGIQNAALRHVAGHSIRTTFVTGMLVSLADEVLLAFLRRESERRAQAWLHAAVWVSFLTGAWLSTLSKPLGVGSFAFPIGAVAVVAAFDLVSPLGAAAGPGD